MTSVGMPRDRAHPKADVLQIEAAHERVAHLDARTAHFQSGHGARGLEGHLQRVDLSSRIEAGGDDLVAGLGAATQELAAPGSVDVDDPAGRVGRREQQGLGLEVVVEGMVVVQVVLGEVGEGSDGEVGAPGALEIKGMRAHFHSHHGAAGIAHPREQLLQIGRFRRRMVGLLHDPGDLVAHGADHAAAVARHLGDVLHEVGRGGLAIGARNAHEGEALRGMVVEGCRRAGHGLAGVGHHHLGHVSGIGQVHLALGHERRGAPIDSVLGEGVPVHHIADDAEEHVAGTDGVAAEGEPRHLLATVADNGAFHSLEKLCAGFGHGVGFLWRRGAYFASSVVMLYCFTALVIISLKILVVWRIP